MKKILFLSLILSIAVLTNCTKQDDDPNPNTGSRSQFGDNSALFYQETVTDLKITTSQSGIAFGIIGTATAGSYQSMTAAFYSGKPTGSYTSDFSKPNEFKLVYVTPNTTVSATSGLAYITVTDSSIVVNFNNALFTGSFGESFKISGQLIYANKKPGDVLTPPIVTNGSVTINGNRKPLTVQSSSAAGVFGLIGYTESATTTLNASFLSGKPTSPALEDLSKNTNLIITYTTGGTTYSATSGLASISLTGSSTTLSFTNAVFTDNSSANTITLSGFMYISK